MVYPAKEVVAVEKEGKREEDPVRDEMEVQKNEPALQMVAVQEFSQIAKMKAQAEHTATICGTTKKKPCQDIHYEEGEIADSEKEEVEISDSSMSTKRCLSEGSCSRIGPDVP